MPASMPAAPAPPRTGLSVRAPRGSVRLALVEPRAEAEDLIGAIAASQDRSAFASLFQLFAPRLKAHYRARRLPDEIAEELTQEVMLRVWRHARQFDRTKSAASTWIYAVARNCFVDRVRREKRPVADPLDESTPEPLVPPAEEALGAAQTLAVVREALTALPQEQGEIIQDVYFVGRSLPEIAEARSLPLGTVKTRVRLALERLRSRLRTTEG
jgi:RNA polymerase sigma-70 factor, ECF subfamily